MDLKKIVLSLCALGLSGAATAGGFMPAPACANQPVTVPCEHSGWDLGVTGYWGRISSGNMEVDSLNLDGVSPVRLNPDYRLGLGLEGSYHWGNGNDVVVEWTHFNKSFQDKLIAFSNGQLVSNADEIINRARFKFDAINFELGQQMNVGSQWDMRAHVGLQELKIARTLDYNFAQPGDFADGDFLQYLHKSRFSGIGPRAGIDSVYHLSQNWSLVGDAAASVLSGKTRASVRENNFNNFVITGGGFHDYGRTYNYVAGLDGKLGVRYNQPIASGTVSITGGYAGNIYMNPIIATSIVDFGEEWNSAYFGVGSFFLSAKYTS